MHPGVKTALKITGYTLGSLVAVAGLYVASSFALSRIPVNAQDQDPAEDVDIYILSNGVHTDIVTPVRTRYIDWTTLVPFDNTPARDASAQYVGFGWGDKGFYLDTPTWAELKASTAFKAMFHLSSSAMHVTFHQTMRESESCVRIRISQEEYQRLIAYIKASFDYDAQGRPFYIQGHSYGQHDSFYEAQRTYSFLYTCNTWANNGLKASGQKACFWTAFDSGIFYQYRRKGPNVVRNAAKSVVRQGYAAARPKRSR
ncbi:TIGR02117 family protein [Hymenobacter cellulosivorans]|uniref:TIGR02117 family protein n=1 Tax=Hymenobacter cellulosivorans TaxID=2932249 RepID=A0ABY4F331_9BACT|nr:TIGR02117 family protein [Hymenobacter cellulosivorans]UOQ51066.1 TIGR02117 family protein [Hymenobacter cellulosivorans]